MIYVSANLPVQHLDAGSHPGPTPLSSRNMAFSTLCLLSGGVESVTLLELIRQEEDASCRALTIQAGLFADDQQLHYSKWNALSRDVPIEVYDMKGIQSLMMSFYPPEWVAVDEYDGPCPWELSALPVAISTGILYCQMAGSERLVLGITKEQERPQTKRFLSEIGSVMSFYDSNATEVQVEAPFLEYTKAEVIKIGVELGVDYTKTWSCHNGGKQHCGECKGCTNRQRAFQQAGINDPTSYIKPVA